MASKAADHGMHARYGGPPMTLANTRHLQSTIGWWLDLKHSDIEIIAIVIVLGLLPIYWLPGIVRLFVWLWCKIKWR